MESDGCLQRVGADPPRSAPKGGTVAESIFTASSSAGSAGPEAFCATSSKDRLRGCPIAVAQPFTVTVAAVAEVKQLQAAIGVLGENSVHAKALQEALRVAQNKAKLPPIEEQLESWKTFLEQARKRVRRAQVVIDRAIKQKAVHESEVAEGQTQTRSSPSRSRAVASTTRDAFNCVGVAGDALRSRPDQPGVSKHSDKWMGEGPPCVENIPPMPSTNVQELEGWISDRNCELRNAVEFGDMSLVAKIGLLVGQLAATWP